MQSVVNDIGLERAHIQKVLMGCDMTQFLLAAIASVETADEAGRSSLGSLFFLSGLRLLASFALMTLGIDLGADWL